MFFVVFEILLADNDAVLMAVFLAVGAAFLAGFFLYIRARERAGKEALISLGLFRDRASNLAPGNPEHPVAAPHGHVVRGLRLPPPRPFLEPDRA